MISNDEFHEALRDVRRELRAAEEAWTDIAMTNAGIGRGGTLHDVRKALERASLAMARALEMWEQG